LSALSSKYVAQMLLAFWKELRFRFTHISRTTRPLDLRENALGR
jgi:hypothetical protein